MKTKGKMVKEETAGFFFSRFKSCPPHTLPKEFKSEIIREILKLLKDSPLSSTEIQNSLDNRFKRGAIRDRLSELWKRGHLKRSPFYMRFGYVYGFDDSEIMEKLKALIPPYVRNSITILLNEKRLFTLNSLAEKTSGDFEVLEWYLDRVFVNQMKLINNSYHKSYKIYWNSKYTKEELLEDFEKEISEIHRRIKVEGSKYEDNVKELLDSYLLRLPFKVEKYSRGTPSGRYFFDSAYNLYLLGEFPIQLKVEIKNHIPNLNEIAFFWRKIREYRHGVIIPVVIAPAFPSVVYRSFGDILYLVRFDKLKTFVNSLKVSLKP